MTGNGKVFVDGNKKLSSIKRRKFQILGWALSQPTSKLLYACSRCPRPWSVRKSVGVFWGLFSNVHISFSFSSPSPKTKSTSLFSNHISAFFASWIGKWVFTVKGFLATTKIYASCGTIVYFKTCPTCKNFEKYISKKQYSPCDNTKSRNVGPSRRKSDQWKICSNHLQMGLKPYLDYSINVPPVYVFSNVALLC